MELPINEFKNQNYVDLKDIINSFYGKAIEFTVNENCPNCGKIDKVNNITTICTLPKYLIIHFRRTVYNRYIRTHINYENDLSINCSTNNKYEYGLNGVIFYHSNSSYYSNSGYYKASCRYGNNWYYFNDSFVDKNDHHHPNTYKGEIILFYEMNN